jgi:hypothetical protein
MPELYELKDRLTNCKNGNEFINKLIDDYQESKRLGSPAMQSNALFYTMGAIDSLYWAGKLTQEEYTLFIKYFGL